MEPLPEKELKVTTGFSLLPSTIDKLDMLCGYLQGNRSQVVEHLINSAFAQIKEPSTH